MRLRTRRWFEAVIATGVMATCGSAAAQSFGAKPGAWENTVTTSGLTIPPDVLAKMPPDRRAMVEKQLAANGGQGPVVRKSCVTKENLERGFMQNTNASCTMQVVSRTATTLVATTSCTSPVPSRGTMSWEAKSPESVVGRIDQDAGGRKVHIDIVGKWLGSSCDGL